MIKYILSGIAVAAIIGIAWPLASNVFGGGGPNEATKLVEATDRTNNKAESLNDSFTDVIPPAPRRAVASKLLGKAMPVNAASRIPKSAAPGGPISPQNTAGGPAPPQAGAPGQPEPSPTPDKYAPYEQPSEHAVRDAIEYLNKLQTELEPTQTQYIMAVEQLQMAWTPRYERAVDEYKRFAYRIDHADAMAQDYFNVQERLTSQIVNQKDRDRAKAIDIRERQVYSDWRGQAYKTLGQAQLIMYDLNDMNVIITKQRLSAHFAALYEDFQTIPPAISLLHEELARFREESNRIQETFGVTPK